jgi:hypothetical protein
VDFIFLLVQGKPRTSTSSNEDASSTFTNPAVK